MLTSTINPNTSSTSDPLSALYSSSLNTNSANAASNNLTSSAGAQDRFLKLLVAQLNNQDPMNPMDNSQMTSQMAEINTVSGIQQLNTTIQSMSTQFTAMQVLQGASMIGHDVLTAGNTMNITNGVGTGAMDLAGNADAVTVQVQTPGGQVLDTINLGAQAAGRVGFSWDASNYTGTTPPVFQITATQAGAAVSTTALQRNTVQAVSSDSTGLTLMLNGVGTVSYSAVKAIL